MGQDVYENEMRVVNGVDYIRGLVGKDSVQIDPRDLPYPNTGSGFLEKILSNGKWYRIAIGGVGSQPSSAIINIGRHYSYGSPSGRLLYVFADGFSGNPIVSQFAKGGSDSDVGKVRILYKGSTTENVMLDIYIKSANSNNYKICFSNNINFSFQTPEEVSEAIPEGYSVKEFSF